MRSRKASSCLIALVLAGCVNDATAPGTLNPAFDHTTPPTPPSVIAVNNYGVTYHHSELKTTFKAMDALFNGGIAYGTGPGDVHFVNLSNGDFDVAVAGLPPFVSAPGNGADHHTVTVLTEQPSQDLGPKSPAGIVTVRETFAWSAAPDDDYVIVKYSLTNTNSAPVTGLRVGYIADPDFADHVTSQYFENRAFFDLATQSARIRTANTTAQHGIGLIGRQASGYAGWQNGPSTATYPLRDPASNEGWWSLLSTTDLVERGPADVRQYIGAEELTIPAGGTEVVAFVLAGGDDAADLSANLSAARARGAALLTPQPALKVGLSIHPGTASWVARMTFGSAAEASAFDAANTRCGGAPILQHAVSGNTVDAVFSALGFDSRALSGDPMHCAGRLSSGVFFAGTDNPSFDDGSLPLTNLTAASTPNLADYNRSGEFSPDGSQIAFASDRNGGGIWIMDAGGDAAGATRVAAGDWLSMPSWSADGSRIYFADVLPCNGGSVNCHVKVVDLATGVVTPLSTNAVDPRISPDGSLIVFRRGSGLGIMNSDGTNAHMIMTEGGSNLYPEWSTDGSRIYFTRIAFDGSEAVYSMDVTGGDLQRLTPAEPGFFRYSTVSRDGRSMLFVASGGRIIHQDMESGLHTTLNFTPSKSAPNIPSGQNLSFAPDGRTALFLGNDGHLHSFTLPGQGTPAEQVAAISASVGDLVAEGLLAGNDGAQLQAMLDDVSAKVAGGQLNAAINHVNAFINKVRALVNSRRLGEIPGQQLTAEATSLATALQGN